MARPGRPVPASGPGSQLMAVGEFAPALPVPVGGDDLELAVFLLVNAGVGPSGSRFYGADIHHFP